MAKLKMNLEYNLDYPAGEKPKQKEINESYATLTKDYVNFAVEACYKDGLNSQFRRLYSKIQKKFEKAIKDKSYEVDLEDGEITFIKKAFSDDKTKFKAVLALYVVVLEDALENLVVGKD